MKRGNLHLYGSAGFQDTVTMLIMVITRQLALNQIDISTFSMEPGSGTAKQLFPTGKYVYRDVITAVKHFT